MFDWEFNAVCINEDGVKFILNNGGITPERADVIIAGVKNKADEIGECTLILTDGDSEVKVTCTRKEL